MTKKLNANNQNEYNRGSCIFLMLILIVITSSCFSNPSEENEDQRGVSTGPNNGHLMIIGGGVNEEIWDNFKRLMGGVNNELIIVPTALNSDSLDAQFLDNYKKRFINLGFKNVTVLHTRDRKVANSDIFIQPLERATGVWLSGGRQWRHADSYLDTKTHEALKDLLDRGGVIAGSSAGATIQGSFLARGDTKKNTIMRGDHQEGFGFITNTAIDQHLLARNRHFDMFDILDKHPRLLGIGIDEKKHGDRCP